MNTRIEQLIFWWKKARYNFRWSDYVGYIDGWIPKIAFSVSIVGYLIIFNDKVGAIITFREILDEGIHSFGLDNVSRLRFLYFGLILLGVSNFIYRIKKPLGFIYGTNLFDYTRKCLDVFVLRNYVNIYETIKINGHLTITAKDYDEKWDIFLNDTFINDSIDWGKAKNKYGDLLRVLLKENFFRENTRKKLTLLLCIFLSTLGYGLLLIPSVDIFLKVSISTLT